MAHRFKTTYSDKNFNIPDFHRQKKTNNYLITIL